MKRSSLTNRLVNQLLSAIVLLSASIALAGAVIAVAIYAARKLSRSSVTPQSVFALCENISAYAIGGVAAFWLIQGTLSFVA